MVEAELASQRLNHGDERLALVDVPLEYVVAYRVAASGHQQAEEYLRVTMLAVLGEAADAQVVLIRCLEVERGHVIEHDAHLAAKDFLCLRIADPLDLLLDAAPLGWREAVNKTVDAVYRLDHVKVTVQIVYRLELTARGEQAAHDQVAEHLILDGVVAYLVIERAINQFRAIHFHLRVGQCGHEIGYDVILLPREWQLRTTLVVNPLLSLALKPT